MRCAIDVAQHNLRRRLRPPEFRGDAALICEQKHGATAREEALAARESPWPVRQSA